jgi:hypothetical protein
MPRVGANARIAHFGGERESATVVAVRDDGRRVDVRTQDGQTLQFVLSPATARFVSASGGQGPRLELLDGAR